MGDKQKKDWAKIREDMEMEEEMMESENPEELLNENKALDYPGREELERELTRVEQEARENLDKSMRALAELENVRRRASEDVRKAHEFGNKKLLEDLLPVVDSLQQACDTARSNEDPAMIEGLELTMKLFMDVLEKSGVQQIDPMGEPFNPQMHEAISMQEGGQDMEPNTVIVVFQKGYTLNGRVIRPARVIVSK